VKSKIPIPDIATKRAKRALVDADVYRQLLSDLAVSRLTVTQHLTSKSALRSCTLKELPARVNWWRSSILASTTRTSNLDMARCIQPLTDILPWAVASDQNARSSMDTTLLATVGLVQSQQHQTQASQHTEMDLSNRTPTPIPNVLALFMVCPGNGLSGC
jgi:hypothetical protein